MRSYSRSIIETVARQDDYGINIWFLPKDFLAAYVESDCEVLCPEERARFEKILIKPKSIARLGSRMMLRQMIAAHLECKPQEIVFAYSNLGKPSVEDENGKEKVYFSVSHTADGSLLSISPRVPHAIDIESLRDISSLESLAKLVLSEVELADLQGLSGEEKQNRFYRYWTCKEAILKRNGSGLSGNPKALTVDLTDEQPSILKYPDTFERTEVSELVLWHTPSWIAAIAASSTAKFIQLHLKPTEPEMS